MTSRLQGMVAVVAVAACSKSSQPVIQGGPGSASAAAIEPLRSIVVPPRCSPSAPGPASPPASSPTNVPLSTAVTVCEAPTPSEVCACLARDLGVLSDGFDHEPGTCELSKVSSPSVQVATIFGNSTNDRLVPAISTVIIARGSSTWAVRGVAETVAEIDLTETPEMSANVEVVAVTEATFGAARFAWIQTSATEEDVAGDERYADDSSLLTICELGEIVRCGRLDLAAWRYVLGRNDDDAEGDEDADDEGADEGCRSAKGASYQAEQIGADGVMLKLTAGADDGRTAKIHPFERPQ
ncbi:MAG: hypothetical protein IPJ61_21290 [Tessaracoccus sp.]|uniref:hypothetical protein n=1 Tax=Tessaracoccus sp. TaxID=1971211 RepID=UPI001EB934A8|nr:hypothetical protein [Tessaracoccus sp.]MBK7823524.1 hypothetical protein [Tessaracoccus sp.]